MNSKLLTTANAATYLGISSDTLRRWEKIGKIQSTKTVNNKKLFNIYDIEKLKLGDVLTVSSAALYLSISESTIRRLSDKNILPVTIKQNGYRTYRLDDLQKYADNELQTLTYSNIDKIKTADKPYTLTKIDL